MSLAVAGLALFVGLLLSSALYFTVLWPQRESTLDDVSRPSRPVAGETGSGTKAGTDNESGDDSSAGAT